MDKKKKMLLIAGAALIVVVLAIMIVITVSRNKQQREYEERKAMLDQLTAETVVTPIADEFGLDDMVYDHVEGGSMDTIVYFSSESYASLDEETRLLFLVAVSEATHLNDDLFPSGSTGYGDYFELVVLSGGHEYMDFVVDGQSKLMEDRNSIYEMPTDFAQGVSSRLRESWKDENSDSAGRKTCKKCGHPAEHLTAAGYCKVCVDTYYTDYYVDWDGQISADRPY